MTPFLSRLPLSIAIASAISIPMLANVAIAEQPPEAVELDVVTVSADFRDTNLQELAEAVTVIGEQLIEQRSAEHLEQILSLAPNVNFSAGSSRARYYQIRGVGERSQFIDPVNPSVGLMIDGIDMTGLGGAATLLDVKQVEILRGPQGTRFGANALGGMINIQSNAPTKETEGFIAAKAGNYGAHGQSGAISGGITENVQGRLAVSSFKTDGYMENDFLNRDNTNNIDEIVLRGKLTAQLSKDTDLNFTYFYTDIDNGYDAFSLSNTRTTYSDNPGVDAQESHSFALDLKSKLSEVVNFEALIATTKADVEYSYDDDWSFEGIAPGWEYSAFDQYLRDYQRNSLDLRLLSGSEGRIFADSTDWVVGIYGFNRSEDLSRSYTKTDTGESRADKRIIGELKNESVSIYGELSTKLSDSLQLTYGVRVESWTTDYEENRIAAQDKSEVLGGGKVTLEYLVNSEHLAYGSLSRGYKAGGINTDPEIDEGNRTFDTEFNNTLELGLKSGLLADSLHTRIAAFYIDRKNQQTKNSFLVLDGTDRTFRDYVGNTDHSKNYGFELESSWDISESLNWQFSYGYLISELGEYTFESEYYGVYDQKGRQQAHAPQYSAATALIIGIADNLAFTVESEAKDEFYFSDSHDLKSEAYVLWHARIAYEKPTYSVAVYGRNLTDRDYEVRGFGFANDPRNEYSAFGHVQYGEPRLVGIEGKYNF
jgi:outer membrane receptor protein involved in Fe transport